MREKRICRRVSAIVGISIACLFSLQAGAGSPSGCTDLDVYPQQPAVDFASQIEPIFSNCAGCHGDGGSAGLDLRPGEAYANLVGVESTTNPPQVRVQPFAPEDSLLLSAVNCATTGGPSFQMPGTNPTQRALIRDWIGQGALQRPVPRSIPVLHPVGSGILFVLILLCVLVFGLRRDRLRA